MMRSPLRTLSLAAALSLSAVPAAAQVAGTVQPRGWIGVSFEILSTNASNRLRTVVTVTDVIAGGPADQAGVRPGDVVLSVNGRNPENQFGGIALALRPGDPVRMVVEREGRRRELQVTAGPRPADVVVAPQSWSLTFEADSMVDRMYRAMDSLRVRLIRDDDGSLAMVASPGAVDSLRAVIRRVPGGNMRVRTLEPGRVVSVPPVRGTLPELAPDMWVPQVRPPFSFFLFRGESYDSLRTEMERLNGSIREVRSRQIARTRELARQARNARIDRNDAELRRLDEQLRTLDLRASELRVAMDEMSRREAGERFGTTWFETRTSPAAPDAPVVPGAELARARPLAPYVLGQNRAAGAEVVDLRPELAAYFEVTGGVLVVDVPEGTPAALAGLQPGDVLVQVDGRDVRSILDLREGIARAASETPLTLIRKGKRMQVLLHR